MQSERESVSARRCHNNVVPRTETTNQAAALINEHAAVIIISYQSRELADRCTKLEFAQQWLGTTNAQALIDLIADAEALDNVAELINYYSAIVNQSNSVLVQFSPKYKVVLKPIGPKIERTASGVPVWEKVRRLMLFDIEEC